MCWKTRQKTWVVIKLTFSIHTFGFFIPIWTFIIQCGFCFLHIHFHFLNLARIVYISSRKNKLYFQRCVFGFSTHFNNCGWFFWADFFFFYYTGLLWNFCECVQFSRIFCMQNNCMCWQLYNKANQKNRPQPSGQCKSL